MLQQNQSTTIPAQFPELEHLNCPRCDSTNTKFCYYNNYNLLQPRHFCKNCRRYWTKGGTLRKIPIGGSTRKITKRSSKSSVATTPPPPTQGELKSGPSSLFGFNNSQSVMRSNESVDELTMNLSGGSETEGLNGAPETEVLRRNQNGNDCGGWTNLSIFTSGSKFH